MLSFVCGCSCPPPPSIRCTPFFVAMYALVAILLAIVAPNELITISHRGASEVPVTPLGKNGA